MTTIDMLRQAVYDDPTDLQARLVLADALDSLNSVIDSEETFWRWTVKNG